MTVDEVKSVNYDRALELGKQAASLGVSSVYGEQQDVDGIRLVPVALSWSGFGAGEDEDRGSGGGGGGLAVPLGAYIRKGDDLRFEPNLVSLVAVGDLSCRLIG